MATKFKTRKRYRLTFDNENTFNTVWSIKLSRTKVWLLSLLCVAAIAALVAAVMLCTPLARMLPGYVKPEERQTHVDATLRVDSLLHQMEMQQAWMANVLDIVQGRDSVRRTAAADTFAMVTDTLITATERERAFVAQWTERERFNVSVLTPVAAQGMTFHSPVGAALTDSASAGTIIPELNLVCTRGATVSAIQEATVVDVHPNTTGGYSVILQHPNDFLSRYDGLAEAFVAPGQKVRDGQALGVLDSTGRLRLQLWHDGNPIPPASAIPL